MKFTFVIQGEGRGHLTQAMALQKILINDGHTICRVIVGKSSRRELPQFFINQIGSPIVEIESPNFKADDKNYSVSLPKTIFFNMLKISSFIRGIFLLKTYIKKDKPDVVVNFYELLCGLYFWVLRPPVRHIVVAHQFLLNHSQFQLPKGTWYDKPLMLLGNKMASLRAEKKIALSYLPLSDENNLYVAPPLLRKNIVQQKTENKNYFLAYLVNDGYAEDIEKLFSERKKDLQIHCFWDKKNTPEIVNKGNGLIFHQLDDKKFMKYMAGCKGYFTTAGFESLCEARCNGKPALIVPVKGHYEQACNALDAQRAGVGVMCTHFSIDVLEDFSKKYDTNAHTKKDFIEWCETAHQVFLKHLVSR